MTQIRSVPRKPGLDQPSGMVRAGKGGGSGRSQRAFWTRLLSELPHVKNEPVDVVHSGCSKIIPLVNGFVFTQELILVLSGPWWQRKPWLAALPTSYTA